MNMNIIDRLDDRKYNNKPILAAVATINNTTIKNPFRELFSKRILSSVKLLSVCLNLMVKFNYLLCLAIILANPPPFSAFLKSYALSIFTP